jgi:hypothetical protein
MEKGTSTYTIRGTTDDVTTCQVCGKPELRGTVILGILDADGNTEDILYAGTTCAAKKIGGTTGPKVGKSAAAANYRRQQAVDLARQQLSWWEPIEDDRAAIRELYFRANPSARGNVNAIERVAEILRSARDCVATAGLSAI